jgi:hypothetical protein
MEIDHSKSAYLFDGINKEFLPEEAAKAIHSVQYGNRF